MPVKKFRKKVEKAVGKDKKDRKPTDLDRVKAFLEKNMIYYEFGSNDGVKPYIFMSFEDNGKTEEPCD